MPEVGNGPFLGEFVAAGAEAQHQVALVLASLGVCPGVAFLAGIGDAKNAAGEDVGLLRRPVIVLCDVRGHLEAIALALVVGGSGQNVFIRNGVGLDGVELEGGRGGVKIFGRGVKLLQHTGEIFGAGRQDREQQEKCRKHNLYYLAHGLPFPV